MTTEGGFKSYFEALQLKKNAWRECAVFCSGLWQMQRSHPTNRDKRK